MLSDCLREMRREFQIAASSGADTVQFTAVEIQVYILALHLYEQTATAIERHVAAISASGSEAAENVISLSRVRGKQPVFVVVHSGGTGGDAA